jgi:hypothetical protein
MESPLSRCASSPLGTTATAWQSQFRAVCSPFALVRQAPNSLEN